MSRLLKCFLHRHKWRLVHFGWGEKQKGAREVVFALVKVFVCESCGEEHDILAGPCVVEYPDLPVKHIGHEYKHSSAGNLV